MSQNKRTVSQQRDGRVYRQSTNNLIEKPGLWNRLFSSFKPQNEVISHYGRLEKDQQRKEMFSDRFYRSDYREYLLLKNSVIYKEEDRKLIYLLGKKLRREIPSLDFITSKKTPEEAYQSILEFYGTPPLWAMPSDKNTLRRLSIMLLKANRFTNLDMVKDLVRFLSEHNDRFLLEYVEGLLDAPRKNMEDFHKLAKANSSCAVKLVFIKEKLGKKYADNLMRLAVEELNLPKDKRILDWPFFETLLKASMMDDDCVDDNKIIVERILPYVIQAPRGTPEEVLSSSQTISTKIIQDLDAQLSLISCDNYLKRIRKEGEGGSRDDLILLAAEFIVDPAGQINLTNMRDAVKSHANIYEKSDFNSEIASRLEVLKKDPLLMDQLNAIGTPLKGNQFGEKMIRETLHLPPDAEMTTREARIAALSAFLGDIRQGQSGSCFATAVAILAHSEAPRLFLNDIKFIIEKGQFERKVDGKIVVFTPPKEIYDRDLDEVVRYQGLALEDILSENNRVKNALKATGIPENKWEECILNAKIENPISVRSILKAIIMEFNSISQEDDDKRNTLEGQYEEILNLQREIFSKEIQRPRNETEIGAKKQLLETLKDEYSKETETFSEKAKKIAKTDEMLDRATNNFTSSHYNKLLHSWGLALANHGYTSRSTLGDHGGIVDASDSPVFRYAGRVIYREIESQFLFPLLNNSVSALKEEFKKPIQQAHRSSV